MGHTIVQLRDLMDLHLFGPAALVRAALPVLRGQGSGTIVQMSSQDGTRQAARTHGRP
jgi:NAD(P)-dependent dehydrogenase (short-subunit alcohol dehydrogenase family)